MKRPGIDIYRVRPRSQKAQPTRAGSWAEELCDIGNQLVAGLRTIGNALRQLFNLLRHPF